MEIKNSVKALLNKPVCNEAYKRKELVTCLKLLEWFDISESDLILKRQPIDAEKPLIYWLVCNFNHPFGGVFTILRIANHLEGACSNKILIYDNPNFSVKKLRGVLEKYFPNLSEENFGTFEKAPKQCDIGIATFWTSAYKLLELNAKHKMYLIQDFEPSFYAAGTQYALCENTYNFPFDRIFNTCGLQDYIDANYPVDGISSMHFTPCADDRYKFSKKALTTPIKVLFYARQSAPRNAYELAFAFAQALEKRYGDNVELYCAGDNTKGAWKNSGIIPYDDLPEFYGQFHFMVAFMLSKHPSYIPFEAMASGAAVITNKNHANDWFFKDGENCIYCLPTIKSLMEGFERALSPALYEKITYNGLQTVHAHNWLNELEKIKDYILVSKS